MSSHSEHDRVWWKRRSFLNVRNGRLVVLTVASLFAGLAATLLTAYLGIR